MYLVEVQLELYIFYPKGNVILSSVATNQMAGLRPTLVLVLSVCVRCSQSLLLPLVIVCMVGQPRSCSAVVDSPEPVILWANKWYQSCTNVVAGLTVGNDERFGDGRQ